MRIVAGRWRGHPLEGPRGLATRPTSDRTRETLFNILASRIDLDGLRVLDLFAGTGALGLEALSRGAASALFVDNAVESRALIRANAGRLGADGLVRVLRRDATRLGRNAEAPFGLVFADPPYGRGLSGPAAEGLVAGGWLAPGALVVVEEAPDAFAAPPGLVLLDRRRSGEAELTLLGAAA